MSKEIVKAENELMYSLYKCLHELKGKRFLLKKDRKLIRSNIEMYNKFLELKEIVETELP